MKLPKFTLFTAAEATVLSFLIMSLVGGALLYFTERNRIVFNKIPTLQNVKIMPVNPVNKGISPVPVEEVHTFIIGIQYKGERFIDTFFTAVSALCVTGLTSTDFSRFTFPGQVIVMLLVQMGGLGIIVFTSIFALAIMRGISEESSFKNLLSGILDTEHHEVGHMIKHVVMYTLLFEGLGFFIMGCHLQYMVWYKDVSLLSGINPWWWSLFHSISAFNNAGLSLMGNNLSNFVLNPVINLTIASLIILGGLGYPVLIAIHTALYGLFLKKNDERLKKLREDASGVMASEVQKKVAIFGTIFFLAIGTLLPFVIEWHNPVFTNYSWPQRLMIAFFQSASTRTAGFNTINVGTLGTASLFLYIILMFIGANPAGTAGGIKIPTLAVLYGYVKDWFQSPGQPVMLFKRRVSKFAVSHSIRLLVSAIIFLGIIIFLITLNEYKYLLTPDSTFNFTKIIFEAFSAFGTVGLSMGFAGALTSFSGILTSFSKFLLILTMLMGRLGPLTVLSALPWKRRYNDVAPSPDFSDVEKIQIG